MAGAQVWTLFLFVRRSEARDDIADQAKKIVAELMEDAL